MKTTIMTELSKHIYVFISVLVFIISDILLLTLSHIEIYYLSKILKGTILLFLTYLSISFINSTQKALLIFLGLLFIFSQFLLWLENKLIINGLLDNVRFFMWYIFVLLLSFLFASNKIYCTKKEVQIFNKLGYAVIIIVCLSIIIGFIFDLEIFRSYKGSRWGYKGIIGKSVTLSYFFIVSLFFIYYQYQKRKINGIYFLCILFCSFLSGTKTVYFFVIFLSGFHVINKKLYKNHIFLIKIVIVSLLIFYYRNSIIENTKFLWGSFYDLYFTNGFAYSISSYRSEMLIEGLDEYIKQWSWYNYLLGGRLIQVKYFEMAFFDLLVFWGPIGTILYLHYINKYILTFFVKENKVFGIFVIVSLLLASFFTGQFLINSTAIIIVYYYLLLFRLNDFSLHYRLTAN